MAPDLLASFPVGFTPRAEQIALLEALGAAIAAADEDPKAPRVLLVEAPPGVGKSHVAMTLARWSSSAYLLTSQKLLQDQYEREFGNDVQLVKGRDNYLCERYPGARVTTASGMCRRRRGPPCLCPYTRAKLAALDGPIFCTNTSYFLTLRQWRRDDLERRRLLVVDEAHTLEAQLAHVFTVSLTPEQMRAWFGAMLPRLDVADDYRALLDDHAARLRSELALIDEALDALTPPDDDAVLTSPPSPHELDLFARRDTLENAIARVGFFLDAPETEWIVRYPDPVAGTLELVPLSVAPWAFDLLFDAADITVLSSAFLGHHGTLAECFGLEPGVVRTLRAPSPFPLERRPIVYRPVGALSRDSLAELEPAVFTEVAAIMAAHPRDKGLIHAPSYAAAERLRRALAEQAPAEHRRLLPVESAAAKTQALELHRASPFPTVLLSPSLREGVDLPDEHLRFQIVTKMPYPDLGDPWTAARQARDHRWYALETGKALVQAYGRSCRHADDHGVTYVLDGQFARFLTRYRPLLPPWFLDAAHAALLEAKRRGV